MTKNKIFLSNNEQQQIQDMWLTLERGSVAAGVLRSNLLIKMITKLIKKGRVLDIGFGNGYFLKKMYKKGYSCHGVDIAKKNVKLTQEECNKRKMKLKLKYGKIDKIPFEDNFFHVIVASEVIEHTNIMDLDEIKRCLKKKGYFIGTVPANENLKNNTCFCPKCGCAFHRYGHQQSFSKQKMQQFLMKSGLEIVSIKRKVINSPNLNFFGKIEQIFRKIINLFWPISGTTYVIIARKIA